MAALGKRSGSTLVSHLMKSLTGSSNSQSLSDIASTEVITTHTAKWMQDTSKKSPMELINEVPPIKVDGRIVACEGGNILLAPNFHRSWTIFNMKTALGHPIEFICLDKDEAAVCKYCGLRYLQDHQH